MPAQELELFQRRFFPKLRSLTEGSGSSFHVGLLYDPSRVDVSDAGEVRRPRMEDKTPGRSKPPGRRRRLSLGPQACHREGHSQGQVVRVPSCGRSLEVEEEGQERPRRSKDFSNRKQIVAEGMRLRELMQGIAARPSNAKHREFPTWSSGTSTTAPGSTDSRSASTSRASRRTSGTFLSRTTFSTASMTCRTAGSAPRASSLASRSITS